MAEAKQCDRCGVYYLKADEQLIRQDEFYVMPRTSNKSKDLCLKCSKELQAFMYQYRKGDSAANVEEAN